MAIRGWDINEVTFGVMDLVICICAYSGHGKIAWNLLVFYVSLHAQTGFQLATASSRS